MPDDAELSRFLTRRNVLRGLGAGLVCVGGAEVVNVLAGLNFHTVIPGAVYRSAQPSADHLERIIKKYGIRTVVNFRGTDDKARWYREECRVTGQYGVSEEDFNGSSSGRLPSVWTIRDLVELLDHSDYPILLHCNRGIDRTGMASAIVLLLQTDASVAEARKQLGFRFAHLPFGRTGNIDRFFDLYEQWLARTRQAHSPAVFRHWMTEEYCPGPCRARIAALDPPTLPARTPCGFRIRCTNTSVEAWRLRPGRNAGIHAWYWVLDENGKLVGHGQSGLFDAVVGPGDGIDLVLALPALAEGTYTLRADMCDEQQGWFVQEGSPPLVLALEVR